VIKLIPSGSDPKGSLKSPTSTNSAPAAAHGRIACARSRRKAMRGFVTESLARSSKLNCWVAIVKSLSCSPRLSRVYYAYTMTNSIPCRPTNSWWTHLPDGSCTCFVILSKEKLPDNTIKVPPGLYVVVKEIGVVPNAKRARLQCCLAVSNNELLI
jgi:hypothetical protein